ncbi:MAG: hypothetical protein HY862_08715 [Chloroflexi bacterium]|nr:hypothetical protein [Chloroflexota bacterium]
MTSKLEVIAPPQLRQRRRLRWRRLLLIGLTGVASIGLCITLAPLIVVFIISRGNPDPIQENFTPDASSAHQYEQVYATTVASINIPGESFTLTFTDAQFASWLDLRYQKATSDEIANIELLDQLPLKFTELQNIQVAFDDEIMSLYAEVPVSKRLTLSMTLDARIYPDNEHQLQVEVITAQIGSVEVPDNLRAELAAPILDALTQNLEIKADYQVDLVTMDNGHFTIIGHINSPLPTPEKQESENP